MSPSGKSVTEENVYPSQRLAWPLSLTAISKVRTKRFHSLSAARPGHSNEAGDLWTDNWRRKPTTVQIHGVPLSGQFRSRRQQRRRTAGGHPSNQATAFSLSSRCPERTFSSKISRRQQKSGKRSKLLGLSGRGHPAANTGRIKRTKWEGGARVMSMSITACLTF